MVIRRGLRRARTSRWASLLLAVLVVATVAFGLGYATGLVRSAFGVATMWLHVAAALTVVPLLTWHVIARRVRLRRPVPPSRADLSRTDVLFPRADPARRGGRSRRGVLRTAVGAAGAGLYLVTTSVVTLAGLPGRHRRFTGSYETGSFQPRLMPNTIWLNDSVPSLDPGGYRLEVVDAAGARRLPLAELARFGTPLRATLDCTSGWYAHQDWTGAPLAALIHDVGDARSVLVRSLTGYWVRLPVVDLPHLLLATAVGGRPLSAGHGFPVRLVAPGRRGFWWVKWVDRIELQTTPWWWQPPFPLT